MVLGFVPSAVPKSRAVGWLRQSCLRWVPSSGAAPTADSVASPDTRPPGDQHFYPVGTRQCLLSGLSCLMRSPGHTGRRETVYAVGDMGLTCGFSGRVSGGCPVVIGCGAGWWEGGEVSSVWWLVSG